MIERGQRRPSRKTLDRILAVLGVANREQTQAYLLLAKDVLLDALGPELAPEMDRALPSVGTPDVLPRDSELPEPLAAIRRHLWPDGTSEELKGLPKSALERHWERIRAHRAQLQALADAIVTDLATHRRQLRAEYENYRRKQ